MEIAIGMKLRTISYEEFVGTTPKKIYGEVVDIVENEDNDIMVYLRVTERIRYFYNIKELESPNGDSLTYGKPQATKKFDNDDLPF